MAEPPHTTSAVPVLPVSDLLRAVAWYQRLGFTIGALYEVDDYAILLFEDAEVHLAANGEIDGSFSWAGCYLRVADASALHQRWMALGAKEVGGLVDQPYGIREFATEDPDRNLWRVGSPIPTDRPIDDGDELDGHVEGAVDDPPPATEAAAPTDGSAGTGDEAWLGVVTDSACAGCGFAPSDATHTGMAGRIVDESHRLGALLTSADDDQVRTRPAPDAWSSLEYGAHVRDTLAVFTERIVHTRREDNPELGWWDHEAALEHSFANELEADAVADDINRNASHLATALSDMSDADWDRPSTRGGDPFTVDLLARYLLHEVMHHRVDVERDLAAP